MKENRSCKLTWVVVLTAIVAAATTIAILYVRAKEKKKPLKVYNDYFDFDWDDCEQADCCCHEGCCTEDEAKNDSSPEVDQTEE